MAPLFSLRGNLVPLIAWLLLFAFVFPCSGTKATECALSAVYSSYLHYCPLYRIPDSTCFQGSLQSGNVTVAINGSAQPLSTATATNVSTHDYHMFTVSLSSLQETGDSISNVAVRFQGPRYNKNYPGSAGTYASLNQFAHEYERISCAFDQGCSISDGDQWIPLSEIPCEYRCSTTSQGLKKVSAEKFIQCTRPVNNVTLYLHIESSFTALDWSFSGLDVEFEVEVNRSDGDLQRYHSKFPLYAVGRNGDYNRWTPNDNAGAFVVVATTIIVIFALCCSQGSNGTKQAVCNWLDHGKRPEVDGGGHDDSPYLETKEATTSTFGYSEMVDFGRPID